MESFDISPLDEHRRRTVMVRTSCAQAGAEMLLGRERVSEFLADMFHRTEAGDEVVKKVSVRVSR